MQWIDERSICSVLLKSKGQQSMYWDDDDIGIHQSFRYGFLIVEINCVLHNDLVFTKS